MDSLEYLMRVRAFRDARAALEAATRERFPVGCWCVQAGTGRRAYVVAHVKGRPDLVVVKDDPADFFAGPLEAESLIPETPEILAP